MPDIIAELIAGISEGIHGPAQPGDPHVIAGPEAAAGGPAVVREPEAGG